MSTEHGMRLNMITKASKCNGRKSYMRARCVHCSPVGAKVFLYVTMHTHTHTHSQLDTVSFRFQFFRFYFFLLLAPVYENERKKAHFWIATPILVDFFVVVKFWITKPIYVCTPHCTVQSLQFFFCFSNCSRNYPINWKLYMNK